MNTVSRLSETQSAISLAKVAQTLFFFSPFEIFQVSEGALYFISKVTKAPRWDIQQVGFICVKVRPWQVSHES
jgi:hypothetical protein